MPVYDIFDSKSEDKKQKMGPTSAETRDTVAATTIPFSKDRLFSLFGLTPIFPSLVCGRYLMGSLFAFLFYSFSFSSRPLRF